MRILLQRIDFFLKKAFEYRKSLGISAVVSLLLFSLCIAIDGFSLKRRASATLLIGLHPSPEMASKGEEKKIQSIQLKKIYAFHREFLQNPLLRKKTYERLKRNHPTLQPIPSLKVNVEKISKSSAIFELSLLHEQSVRVLNTFIQSYLTEYFENQIMEKERFLKRMQEGLVSLEDGILRQEIALFEMRQTEGRSNASPVERLTQYFRSLEEIRKKIRETVLNEEIAQQIEMGKSLSAYSLSKRLQEYAALYNEFRSLSGKYKSGYPLLTKLQNQISQQKNILKSEKARFQQEEEALIEKIKSIQKKTVQDPQGDAQSYSSQERSLEINKKTYFQLNENIQKVGRMGFHQNTDIQILNLAHISASSFTFGSLVKGISSVLLMVLLVLLGSAYSMEWYGKQKLSVKHIPNLNLKTLGTLPSFDVKRNKSLRHEIHLILDQNPDHPIGDEIRRIHNQLLIEAQNKNVKTILFTHMGPQARNINVVSNLGVAVARNKKVLLVDASWHSPLLDTICALENRVGLLDVLLKRTELNRAVQTTEIPNLYILSAGPHLPLDFGLLSSPSMKMLLDEAEVLYDFVFIEAPSCFEYSDIFTLAQYVQGIVLVQDSREKIKSMLAYRSGLSRDDIEGLSWIGRVHVN